MDELISKYGWKKVAGVLVGVSVLFLLFVIVSFADIDKEANETQKKKDSSKTTQSETRINRIREGREKYYSHKTNYYDLSYPESYTLAILNTASALSSVKFTDSASSAVIEVVVFENSGGRLSELSLPYENSMFTKSTGTHPVGPMVEFAGILGGTLRQKVVLITKGDTVIRFIDTYQDENFDQVAEQIFSDMLLSIK
ncbi:MAG: hypothetical protein Q7T54_05905 [Candidatus Levybacteria bacterium]|nr:hypothetical protein [Candidatus Levybacteria bacterium]